MFRNFVDPPSLDRNSRNESQKPKTNHVNTNGGSRSPNDSQVYYHHNGDASPQLNGHQNGGYTTSIYVGSKSDNSRLPQPCSNPQQQQQQPHHHYQQQQHSHTQKHPPQLYYNNTNQRQQIPQYEQNGQHHPQPHLNGHVNDRRGSAELETHLVQQHLAGASLNETTTYVNGNENAYVSAHHSSPNASYPSVTPGAPTHGHIPQPAPARGHHHALGSIMENGVYEDTEEDIYTNHQSQLQMYSQQHHQQQQHHHQQLAYAQNHQQQQPTSGQFVPPTRPQQSWGSGWATPVAAQQGNGSPSVSSSAGSSLQRRYNVIPPPPPLSEPVFAGRRDVKRPSSVQESQIVSEKGTVRGFKNRVRAGIATFWAQPQDPRNFRQLEQGKIVIYATSMSVVRETSERCKSVRHLLQNHMVRYEERDLYMSREIQQELDYRLQQEGVTELRLPHVFADGIHLGGSEELEKLNEAGELRAMLNNYQKITVRMMCERCGGYRFVPCDVCHGSKRSLLRNHFTEEFCALRCMHCNESGLKRCDLCRDQQE